MIPGNMEREGKGGVQTGQCSEQVGHHCVKDLLRSYVERVSGSPHQRRKLGYDPPTLILHWLRVASKDVSLLVVLAHPQHGHCWRQAEMQVLGPRNHGHTWELVIKLSVTAGDIQGAIKMALTTSGIVHPLHCLGLPFSSVLSWRESCQHKAT